METQTQSETESGATADKETDNGTGSDAGTDAASAAASASTPPTATRSVRLLSPASTALALAGTAPMLMRGIARPRTTHFGNAGWSQYLSMEDGRGREGYTGWMDGAVCCSGIRR